MFPQLCRSRSRNLLDKIIGRQKTNFVNTCGVEDQEITLILDPFWQQRLRGRIVSTPIGHTTVIKKITSTEVTIANYDAGIITDDEFGHNHKKRNQLKLKAGFPEVPIADELCKGCLQPEFLITDNPAYGLSSKNWLELKEAHNDPRSDFMSMEEEPVSRSTDSKSASESLTSASAAPITSQQIKSFDPDSKPSQFCVQDQLLQTKPESSMRETRDTPSNDKCNDLNSGIKAWSVLKPRIASKTCDIRTLTVADESERDLYSNQDVTNGFSSVKKNPKDRPFPLSLMRPNDKKAENLPTRTDISRQKPVQKNFRERYRNTVNKDTDTQRVSNELLGMNNPLSEIAQIKTEESIQEWLARISEPTADTWTETDTQHSPGNINHTDEQKRNDVQNEGQVNKNTHPPTKPKLAEEKMAKRLLNERSEELNTADKLNNASKASPANIPMVIMQCSRLHSHIGFSPPFRHTSLPMGTLVTALYQESDWLYVLTPHGLEGFVSSSNCAPIGTTHEPAQASRRPWEPCDFPIQVSITKKHNFRRQQGSYISTTLPTAINNKQSAPFVSTVKMKTNFYSDRYFPNHTFKPKDLIKTAKTVTDILRTSPETKISNQ